MDSTMPTTMAAIQAKIDWKAWKRMTGLRLYGSSTRNRMPVRTPTR